MSKILIRLLFVPLITLPGRAFGQAANNSLEVSPFWGLKIFSVTPYQMAGNFYGVEGAYHMSMAGNTADWVRMLNVRDISFTASYRHLDNVYMTHFPGSAGELGHAFGLGGRLSMAIADIGKTNLMLYPGFGACYTTETFETSGNQLIGSKLNFSITLGLKLLTPIGAKTRISYGFDIYHYSNAAVKLPNEGVNTLNASIGIERVIDAVGPTQTTHAFNVYKKSSFDFGLSLGRRGLVATGSGLTGQAAIDQRKATSQLYSSAFYVGYNYRVNPIFSLKAATDAIWTYTAFNSNNFYPTFQERASSFDHLRTGVSLGGDLWLGRVAIEGSYGRYLHFNSYYPEKWYWNVGAKYYINQWLALEGKLHLHGTEANFAGYGLLFTVK